MAKKGAMAGERIITGLKIAINIVILLFLIVGFFGCASMVFYGGEEFLPGNVAKIPITGSIGIGRSDGMSETSSTETVELLSKASEDDSIKAIILDINSPGGTPVASMEIANAVKRCGKPVVAVIRDMGTSGAYWVASASEMIFASPVSVTGSIGVRGSYLDFAGLLDDYNITYNRIVGGKYKDIGSPMKILSGEEMALLQRKIDSMHSFFISEVAANRGIPEENVREMATGIFYTGIEALELGLIDGFGGLEEAKDYLEESLGIEVEVKDFNPSVDIYDLIYGVNSQRNIVFGKNSISFS